MSSRVLSSSKKPARVSVKEYNGRRAGSNYLHKDGELYRGREMRGGEELKSTNVACLVCNDVRRGAKECCNGASTQNLKQ
jgi:hypothetical protein